MVETAYGKVRGYVFRGISIFRGLPYLWRVRVRRHFDLGRANVHRLQQLPWRDIRRANRDITRETRLRCSPTLDVTTFAGNPSAAGSTAPSACGCDAWGSFFRARAKHAKTGP